MRRMLDGYDELCRCTPGLMYYFLKALKVAGMEGEARELVEREWGKMLAGGATTTWETFLGNEKDSLCHPWGISPALLLHGEL